MKIKKGDIVKIISGSYSGKEGRVLKVLNDEMSIRKGRYGPYVMYKTKTMKKPKK